jgi:hypothetical protein
VGELGVEIKEEVRGREISYALCNLYASLNERMYNTYSLQNTIP